MAKRSAQAAKQVQASGGARLKAAGRIPMTLGWRPEDLDAIRAAADSERIFPTQFVMRAALRAAEEKKLPDKAKNA